MVGHCRDFWIRETGTGQQVAQLHGRYMMMMMMMMMMKERETREDVKTITVQVMSKLSAVYVL